MGGSLSRPAPRCRLTAPQAQTDPVSVDWAVVVPVKLLTLAKTRLAAYGEQGRAELALAFACDVVTASLACRSVICVLVVTDDVRAAAALSGPHVLVVGDGPNAGLNPALEHGVRRLNEHCPGAGVAALSADLPCLRPEELAAILGHVTTGRAFVPDAIGLGTTLLMAAPEQDLRPAFGPDSRRLHRESGAVELTGTRSVRRDVDTPQDLIEALRLGVGQHTAEITSGLPAPQNSCCSPGAGRMCP